MFKKTLYIIIVLGIAAVGIWGIKHLQKPQEITRITIACPGRNIEAVPQFLGGKLGFFKEFGGKVYVEEYPENTSYSKLLAGSTDIILTDLANYLYAKNKNPGLIAFAALTTGETTYLLGKEKTESLDWNELEGGRVTGEAAQSTGGILLRNILNEHNITPYRNISIFYNIPDDLHSAALITGTSPFLQAKEPTASQLELEGAGYVIKSFSTEKIPALLYITTKEHLQKEPEKIQIFTEGLQKSFLWMKCHPGLITSKSAPGFKDIDRQVLDSVVNRYIKEGIWPSDPVIKKDEYDKFVKMMVDTGELQNSRGVKDGIDNSFAEYARDNVEYIPPEKQKKGLRRLWPF